MVTEVGAAISDWDRDGRMWWLALAGKTRRSHASRLFESLYMRIIASRKLLQGSIRKGRCGNWPNMLQVLSKSAPQQSEHEHFVYNCDY